MSTTVHFNVNDPEHTDEIEIAMLRAIAEHCRAGGRVKVVFYPSETPYPESRRPDEHVAACAAFVLRAVHGNGQAAAAVARSRMQKARTQTDVNFYATVLGELRQ